jgi:hypothetical protein
VYADVQPAFIGAILTTVSFVIVTQLFVYHYQQTHTGGVLSEGPGIDVFRALFQVAVYAEGERDTSLKSGDLPMILVAGAIAAASSIYCLFLGLLGAVGAGTFPVLELLVGGWLVGRWLDKRRSLRDRTIRLLHYIEGIEERIYGYISLLSSGRQGVYGLIIITFGFSITVGLFQTSLNPAVLANTRFVLMDLRDPITNGDLISSVVLPLVEVGWFVVPIVVGLYNLWYWYRLLLRLPHSVESQLNRELVDVNWDLVRRPSLSILFGSWFLFIVAQLSQYIRVGDLIYQGPLQPVFAVPIVGLSPTIVELVYVGFALWPLIVVALVYSVITGDRNGGTPQLGMYQGTDDGLTEEELRLISVVLAVIGSTGMNIVVALVAMVFYSDSVSSLYGQIWTHLHLPPLSTGFWLTYLYIGLAALLLSWAFDNIPDPNRTDTGIRADVDWPSLGNCVAHWKWVYLALISIVIVTVELVFQVPLPLFAYILYSVPAVTLLVVLIVVLLKAFHGIETVLSTRLPALSRRLSKILPQLRQTSGDREVEDSSGTVATSDTDRWHRVLIRGFQFVFIIVILIGAGQVLVGGEFSSVNDPSESRESRLANASEHSYGVNGVRYAIIESDIRREITDHRRANNLDPLTVDPRYSAFAQYTAEEMVLNSTTEPYESQERLQKVAYDFNVWCQTDTGAILYERIESDQYTSSPQLARSVVARLTTDSQTHITRAESTFGVGVYADSEERLSVAVVVC